MPGPLPLLPKGAFIFYRCLTSYSKHSLQNTAELFHSLCVLSPGVANYIFVLFVPLDSDQGVTRTAILPADSGSLPCSRVGQNSVLCS